MTIDNIRIKDTFRSAIAIESVDGAEIENVQVSNVHAVNTGNAIFIRLGHRSGEQPGYLRNVTIKDVYVEVPFGRPDINYDLRGPAVTFFHNPFPSSISGIPGHDIEKRETGEYRDCVSGTCYTRNGLYVGEPLERRAGK